MTPRQMQTAAGFTLVGMALVIITHLVRPQLDNSHQGILFVFGVLPNFAAAFALPFLMVVFVHQFLRLKLHRDRLSYGFVFLLVVTVCGLIAWEIVQNLLWGYPVDPNDIAATGLGGMCALIAYMLFLRTPHSI
jgi:hypothetical protein